MSKSRFSRKSPNRGDEALLERAGKQWEQGKLRSAFRLFLAGAKVGDSGCQINLGNFYSDGTGVKPNRAQAPRSYRRAYQQGERSGASNIGVVLRDQGKLKQALAWFERAVRLKDGDANLEIAKIYLVLGQQAKAVRSLVRLCQAKPGDVTEASKDEGRRLLGRLGETAP